MPVQRMSEPVVERLLRRRVWLTGLTLLLCVASGHAQESAASAPPTTTPTSQPTSAPTSQPTATQAAEQERHEARLTKELAEEAAQEARTELETVRQEKTAHAGLPGLLSALAEADEAPLTSDEALAEREVRIQELRKQKADTLAEVAERKLTLEGEGQAVVEELEAIAELTTERREELAQQYAAAATALRESAQSYWALADQERARVAGLQEEQRAVETRRAETAESDPVWSRMRDALEQIERLIDSQRLIGYVIADKANAEWRLAGRYEQAAEQLRAYNQRFWIRYRHVWNAIRYVLYTVAATFGISVLAWLVNSLFALGARWLRHERAMPTIKRGRTLVHFARSIVKLFIWLFATIAILGEFGVSPGQSAGALGVIGLVLAGMFQQLVVDFVKGIDIAVGGHYFVGDFIQVGGSSGHVLDFSVKYTVLRTPSGQVVTLPNSQCIPSRRFPAGFVDNYVDVPVARDANLEQVRNEIADLARDLNTRIEAIKREPRIVGTFRRADRTILRVQVRVLPTCDWVIRDYFVPLLKRRCEAAHVTLVDEPSWIHINDVTTFRRLFSRQMNEREIAAALEQDARPTIERDAMPDEVSEDGRSSEGG